MLPQCLTLRPQELQIMKFLIQFKIIFINQCSILVGRWRFLMMKTHSVLCTVNVKLIKILQFCITAISRVNYNWGNPSQDPGQVLGTTYSTKKLPLKCSHLQSEHCMDNRSATAQTRIQLQIVSQLETALQKEMERLQVSLDQCDQIWPNFASLVKF